MLKRSLLFLAIVAALGFGTISNADHNAMQFNGECHCSNCHLPPWCSRPM